jgi:hypothetical protein
MQNRKRLNSDKWLPKWSSSRLFGSSSFWDHINFVAVKYNTLIKELNFQFMYSVAEKEVEIWYFKTRVLNI